MIIKIVNNFYKAIACNLVESIFLGLVCNKISLELLFNDTLLVPFSCKL